MAHPGERRFTFRLYGDNPEDRELLRKMDSLLADGKFRSKNEILRQGIALAYEACYGAPGKSQVSAGIRISSGLTEYEIGEASRMIAEEVISRIGGSIPGGSENSGLPEATGKITDEMASFLSGLNPGG